MTIGEIGTIIQQRREILFLKQEDLSEMAGVTTKTIYMIEKGKGNPSVLTLQKLFSILGLQMNVQVKRTEE
jgi:DNA-binding XRE family transcriptional regulator